MRKEAGTITLKDHDLPATQGLVYAVRSELKADIRALKASMNSRFDEFETRFGQIDARFKQIDASFGQMNSRFEEVLSEVSRVGVLVEEQNSRNRVVLDGLSGLWHRQDRVEKRVDGFEDWFRSLGRSR